MIRTRSKYWSDIDPWTLPLLAIVPLLPAVAAMVMREPVAYLSFLLVFLLYLLLVFPVSYGLEPEFLEIRSGVLRWRISYTQVRSVRPAGKAFAGLAVSRDRLEILYGPAGRALVSPRDQRAFLSSLYARAPHLQMLPVPNSGI